jgi:hypothetical protein
VQTKRAVTKPVDGELGCVTPYIICPGGNWTDADLEFQAGQVPRRHAASIVDLSSLTVGSCSHAHSCSLQWAVVSHPQAGIPAATVPCRW